MSSLQLFAPPFAIWLASIRVCNIYTTRLVYSLGSVILLSLLVTLITLVEMPREPGYSTETRLATLADRNAIERLLRAALPNGDLYHYCLRINDQRAWYNGYNAALRRALDYALVDPFVWWQQPHGYTSRLEVRVCERVRDLNGERQIVSVAFWELVNLDHWQEDIQAGVLPLPDSPWRSKWGDWMLPPPTLRCPPSYPLPMPVPTFSGALPKALWCAVDSSMECCRCLPEVL